MTQRICVIGSTGLLGKHFLESISAGDFGKVTAITRRLIPSLNDRTFIKQSIHDFSDLESMRPDLKADVLICTLGTTIKTAGSQDAFVRVDHDLPIEIAKIAKEEGCKSLVLISSVGANAQSKIFYSQVKGKTEEALEKLGFEQFHILRPSMLLGKRQESRPGEFIGKIIMSPLAMMIPWKYKPIHANTIAAKIQALVKASTPGEHIWEGRSLFRSV